MKKINTILACFLFVFSSSIHAQVSIEWQKTLQDTIGPYGYGAIIQQTTDGGYVVTGSSWKYVPWPAPSNYDIRVIKLNPNGQVQWEETLGESDFKEVPSSIRQTTDGGCIIAASKGVNRHTGDSATDYWIIKLATGGAIQWEKSLGGSGEDYPTDIRQTTDGGYIVAGISNSNDGNVSGNHGNFDCWIVKLSAIGNVTWQKSFGGSGWDGVSAIRQTSDGGYMIGASSGSNDGDVIGNHGAAVDADSSDLWLVKLNSAGSIQWQKCIGGSGFWGDYLSTLEQTVDSGYIIAGSTNSVDGDVNGCHYNTYGDSWLVKVDDTGIIQWQKCLRRNSVSSIKQTSDGGYIMAGGASGNYGSTDYWIVKFNSSGDSLWQKFFGGSRTDLLYNMEQTSDGGYIVAGASESYDGDVTGGRFGNEDFWVVKLTAERKLLAPVTTTVTTNITGTAATDVDSAGYKLVTLTPTGGAPNALSGDVTTTVTVNSTISTYNNLPFVRRHYDITPSVNPANSQAMVTLYFTQHDFDLFNAYVTTNNLNIPLLPTGGVDNGNVRITQFHGNFTGTSDPANYNNGTTLITPPSLVVVWDNSNDYWAVTFPVTHFSGFYLSTAYLTALPLTLLEFKGRLQQDVVNLQWLTTNEVNTREFVVERSNSGIGYTAIGKVSAQSTFGNHQYNFSDAGPLPGNNFYRLKMTDIDGNFTYSNIVQIKINDAVSKISVYPNPLISNSINLQFINQPKGIYSLRLINYSGQVILTRQIPHDRGSSAETLNLNNSIQKGYYVLEVIAPDNSKHAVKIIY